MEDKKVVTFNGDLMRRIEVLQSKLGMSSFAEVVRLLVSLKLDYVITHDLDVRLM